ncbi:MAG: acetolactate decarboxylase [Kiritimatiellae bacterium]|nr:acetolactate decarboxylase [Kiritimatiellia bacterium]
MSDLKASISVRLAAAFTLVCALSGCRTTYTTIVQDRETVTQLAPFIYILSGNYDGSATVSDFKAAGDLGIGTFAGLDGEAVMLDGIVYQVKGDGSVTIPDDRALMPFGACTLFDCDRRHKIKNIKSYESFGLALEDAFDNPHIFYAVKAEGVFSRITVRSCDRQTKPYVPLSEATKLQHEYTYSDIKGTLVGFWTPHFMPGAVGVPGFHLHFISNTRTQGGHVLDFAADYLDTAIDPTPRVTIDFSAPADVPLMRDEIDRHVHDSEKKRK